jgi:uncharacterized protein
MSFNEGSQLDTSQVQDRRGMGRGAKIGGGVGGGLILLLAALFGINPQLLEGLVQDGSQVPQAGPAEDIAATCRTGEDANQRIDCRIVGTANSLNDFWAAYLPQYGVQYPQPETVLFQDQVSTACGTADSAVGPFYCPADQSAYFDTGFFDQLVQLGSSGGALAEEYVVAHEFGHHIQNLTGAINFAQQDPQGPESGAVRVELQADCYAGLWAAHAATVPDPDTGLPYLDPIDDRELADALSAAEAVGDDRIQESVTGRVNPEAWTHGSSEQRQTWFLRGYQSGDINQCNTLEAADLDNPR